MKFYIQYRDATIALLTAIVIFSASITRSDDANTSCWRVVSKRFTPIKRAADVVLFQGNQKAVTAMDLGTNLLLSVDASNGQILTKVGPRESNPQCLLREGDKVLLVQDNNRGPEVCTFSAEFKQESVLTPMWVRESASSEALATDSRTHNPIF